MPRSVLYIFSLALLASLLASDAGSAESVQARVTGIPAVNLRAQPDTQSPVVAWLSEGDRVEVRRVSQGWAFVATARGHTGYVRLGYLAMPAGTLRRLPPLEEPQEAAALPVAAAPTARPTLRPTAEATEATTASLATPGATPRFEEGSTPETVPLADGNAEIPKETVAPALEPDGNPLTDIREDVRVILAQTKAIDERLAAQQAMREAATTGPANSTRTWVLIGIGVVIGMVLGSAYGRWQERNKRTRLRI